MNPPKQLIKIAATLFPKVLANIAYQQLTNPQVRKLRPNELAILEKADKKRIKFRGFSIQTYKWGNPKQEAIFLIHGWEGQAGNFSDLIQKLVHANYYVIAFDAPSHGFSSKGDTSPFEFRDLVGQLLKKYNCKKLISHSFGGVATTGALYNHPELVIDKYVLLTTPDKFSQRIDAVVEQVGVTQKVKEILIKRLEKEMEVEVQSLSVSRFTKSINVNKALIIHDKNDRVIPLAYSRNVYKNWPNCELKVVEGTGHFRILRTESVLEAVIAFMN